MPQVIRVATYLVPAILTSFFCCLPFGIVAIVYAARANALTEIGDLARARTAARTAKIWVWLSFGFGLWIPLLYVGGMMAAIFTQR